jgi:hypothetical protein
LPDEKVGAIDGAIAIGVSLGEQPAGGQSEVGGPASQIVGVDGAIRIEIGGQRRRERGVQK